MRIDESAHPPKGWTKWAIPINIHTNSNAVGSLNGTFQNIAAAITTTITFSYWKPDVTCAGWINQYCRQIGVHFFAQPLRCRVWKWGLDGVWQLIPTSQWNWERKIPHFVQVCVRMCQAHCLWRAAISFISDWHLKGFALISVYRYVSLCIHNGMRTMSTTRQMRISHHSSVVSRVSFPKSSATSTQPPIVYNNNHLKKKQKNISAIELVFEESKKKKRWKNGEMLWLFFYNCLHRDDTVPLRVGGCGNHCGGGGVGTFNRIMNSRDDMRW